MDLSNIVFRQQLNSVSKSISDVVSAAESASLELTKRHKNQLATSADADIMCADAKSGTDHVPIWVSCLLGDLEGVRSALANGQNVNDRSPGGVPGLMYACSGGHNGILDLMLVDFIC